MIPAGEPPFLIDLPPVPWVRERDVDLLLAELLSTEPSLTAWMVDREQRRSAAVPHGEPSSVRAVVNYSRPGAGSGASGETDVLVDARYPDSDDTLLLSIEDKVWAAHQRNQGKRHRAFVEGRGARWGLAVLIGPGEWISTHPDEAREYHLVVDLEAIAEWCDDNNFEFQAAVFRQACVPPDFDLAPDLQDWHTAVDNLLAEEFGLRLAPQRYIRTRNTGSAKPNRWASCEVDTLTPVRGAQQPLLVLRPASTNHPSRAAIDIPKAPADLVEHMSEQVATAGLSYRVTRADTLLIERHVVDASGWTVAAPFEEQIHHLRAIGGAAIELRTWWNSLATELDHTSR